MKADDSADGEPASKRAKTDGEDGEAAEDSVAVGGKEREEGEDFAQDGRPRLAEPVAFHTEDMTMNVLPSVGGLFLCATEGGAQHLLAGTRCNAGLKAGRHVFEVKVLERLHPPESRGVRQAESKHVLRIGVSTEGSLPLLGTSDDSVCFDCEGHFVFNRKRSPVARTFESAVVAVVLNLAPGSANADTISLFADGARASEPFPIPEALKGKPLFPTVTWKNLTVHVNLGSEIHAPLPFGCRTVQQAAKKDVHVTPKRGKGGALCEVVLPVCLPEEGGFDWLDMFLQENPHFGEVSERKCLEWALKSGLWKPAVRQSGKNSVDRPDVSFGVPSLDDGTVKQTLTNACTVQRRDLVLMEVRGNLTQEDREQVLQQFRLPHFKKVARVMIGEPPNDFKLGVQQLMLQDKQDKAITEFQKKREEAKKRRVIEARQKEVEKARRKAERIKKRLEEERQRKLRGDDDPDPADFPKDDDDVEPEDKVDDDVEEDPPEVSLTEEEKNRWFRKRDTVPEVSAFVLSSAFQKFSLPTEAEGFDEIRYDWSSKDACEKYLARWIRSRKATTRIEDLQPSDWFKERWAAWQKDLQVWHAKFVEFKNSDVGKKREQELIKRKESEGDRDPMELLQEILDADKLDVFGVEDITDSGEGEPIFSQFSFEDWALLILRFELHLLVHAFQHDAKDDERAGVPPEHAPFYYQRYYRKALNPKVYGVESVHDVVHLVRDAVVLSARTKMLVSQLPADLEANDIFVKLTEECRRDRRRRLDSGDEGAQLKFMRAGLGSVPVERLSLLSNTGASQLTGRTAGLPLLTAAGLQPQPAPLASTAAAWSTPAAQGGQSPGLQLRPPGLGVMPGKAAPVRPQKLAFPQPSMAWGSSLSSSLAAASALAQRSLLQASRPNNVWG